MGDIQIGDIPGLEKQLALINDLNALVSNDVIKTNSIVGYKTLEAGYNNPQLDFSYNLNV